MAVSEDKTRVTMTISKAAYDELTKYAERFRKTEAQIAAMMMEVGLESFASYERWFLKIDTAATLAVTMDSVCSTFGLPRFFKTTKDDEKMLAEIRKGRRELKGARKITG
jgi:hypothetical protein